MNIVSWLETLNGLGFKTAWVLLSLLWQSSILLAAAGLLAFVLRRKRASVRHAVWIIALLAAPALPLLGWFGSYLNAPQREIPVMPSYSAPVMTPPTPRVEFYQPPQGESLPPPLVLETQEETRISLTAYPWALAFIIYATGLILFLSLVVAGRLRIGRWIRKGVVVRDTRVLGAFQTARQHFGLKRPFLLVEGKDVQAPMTIRTFHPAVLLPTGLAQSLSDGELRAVAIHEMAHIKRNDGLLLTLASFVRAVLFFHPLIWLACRQVSLLAEQVADDAVLEATGEALPYAQMLARLAEGLTRRSLSTELAAGIVLSKSAFLRRVEAILSDRRDQIRKLSRLALAGTILATIISLALATALPLGEKSPPEVPAVVVAEKVKLQKEKSLAVATEEGSSQAHIAESERRIADALVFHKLRRRNSYHKAAVITERLLGDYQRARTYLLRWWDQWDQVQGSTDDYPRWRAAVGLARCSAHLGDFEGVESWTARAKELYPNRTFGDKVEEEIAHCRNWVPTRNALKAKYSANPSFETARELLRAHRMLDEYASMRNLSQEIWSRFAGDPWLESEEFQSTHRFLAAYYAPRPLEKKAEEPATIPAQDDQIEAVFQKLHENWNKRNDFAWQKWVQASAVEKAKYLNFWMAQKPPKGFDWEPDEEEATKFLDSFGLTGKGDVQERAILRQRLGMEGMRLTRDEEAQFSSQEASLIDSLISMDGAAIRDLLAKIQDAPWNTNAAREAGWAAEALGRMGDEGIEALAQEVEKTFSPTQHGHLRYYKMRRLVQGLASSQSPQAIPALRRALDLPNRHTRGPAIDGLAKIPGGLTQEILLALWESSDDYIREKAARFLAERGDEKAIETFERDIPTAYAKARYKAEEAVWQIKRRLGLAPGEPPERVRVTKENTDPWWQGIEKSIKSPNKGIRVTAVERLAFEAERNVDKFTPLLEVIRRDPDREVRLKATESTEYAFNRQVAERTQRRENLAPLNEVFDTLAEAAAKGEEDIAAAALRAAYSFRHFEDRPGYQGVIKRVLEGMDSSNTPFRASCMWALHRLFSNGPELIRRYVSPAQKEATFRAVMAGLSSEYGRYKMDAISVATMLGFTEATPALAEIVNMDKRSNYRSAAARALGKIGDARAIPALEHMAETDPHVDQYGLYSNRETAWRAIQAIQERVGKAKSEKAKAPEFKQVRYFASPIFWRVDGYGKVTFDGELESPGGGFWKVYYSAPDIIDRAEWYDRTGVMIRYALFKYDQEGNIIEIDAYKYGGDPWIREKYSYDEQGRVAEVIHFGTSGRPWRARFKYDAQGKKSEAASYDSQGVLQGTWKMKLDEHGRTVESNYYHAKGELKVSSKSKYDDAGRRVEEWIWDGFRYPEGKLGERTTKNKYNDQGWLIERATYDAEGKIRDLDRYKYTEDGRLLERLERFTPMNRETSTSIEKFKYDDEGRIVESTRHFDDRLREITKYNEFQRRKETLRYDEKGEVRDRSDYDYDEKGRIIKTSRFSPDGRLLQMTRYYENLKVELIYYDEEGEVKERWEYDRDEEGRRIQRHYGPDGKLQEIWQYDFDEDGKQIRRRYDADGNLREIRKYDIQRLEETIHYDEKGNLSERWEYVYDEEDRQTERRHYGPDDKLRERWEYEYAEQGRRIRTRHYGPDGKLIEEEDAGRQSKGAQVPEEAAVKEKVERHAGSDAEEEGQEKEKSPASPARPAVLRAAPPEEGRWTPADWSPDGTEILAYLVSPNGSRLYRLNVASGETKVIVSYPGRKSFVGASFSPDGKKVAFTTIEDNWPVINIYTVKGEELEKIFINEGEVFAFGHWPQWLLDGERLVVMAAFKDSAGNINCDLCVLTLEDKCFERLTQAQEVEWLPSISPDGSKIAYAKRVAPGHNQLCIIDLESRRVETLTQVPDVLHTSWSPDGNKIAFDTYGSGPGVWVIDSQVGAEPPKQITQDGRRPLWSPDGKRIAFQRDVVSPETYSTKIYIWDLEKEEITWQWPAAQAGDSEAEQVVEEKEFAGAVTCNRWNKYLLDDEQSMKKAIIWVNSYYRNISIKLAPVKSGWYSIKWIDLKSGDMIQTETVECEETAETTFTQKRGEYLVQIQSLQDMEQVASNQWHKYLLDDEQNMKKALVWVNSPHYQDINIRLAPVKSDWYFIKLIDLKSGKIVQTETIECEETVETTFTQKRGEYLVQIQSLQDMEQEMRLAGGVRLDRESAELYNSFAGNFEVRQQYELAIVEYDKIIKKYPDDTQVTPGAYIGKAMCYMRLKKYDKAISSCDDLLKAYKDSSAVGVLSGLPLSFWVVGATHNAKSLIYETQERWDLALAEYQKCLNFLHQKEDVLSTLTAENRAGYEKIRDITLPKKIQECEAKIACETGLKKLPGFEKKQGVITQSLTPAAQAANTEDEGDITEIDEQVFEKAGQLLREKKFMEAVEELKTIAETYKDETGNLRYIFFKARWLLADTYIELGDSAGGRKILLTLIPELEGKMGPRIYQHYPAGFQTYCLCISSIGLSYQTEGKFAEAEEWYEKCREILLAERAKIEAQGEAYPYPKLNDWIEGRLRAHEIMIANVRKWRKVNDEVVLLLHEPAARVTPFGHSQNILLYKADWADSEKLWEKLFLYSLTEGKKIDLTSGRISGHIYAYFPPNSNFVIFSGIGIEDDNHHLYTYSLDAGTFNEISIALPTSYIGPLSATADGKVIVFEALYPDETGLNMDISIMDSSDGSVRRLTNHPAKDRHPDISPDGQYVAFYSMRGTTDHGYDIYMVKADGTGEVRRLTTDMEAAYPCWLPDGKAIIFVSFLKGSRGIWKVSPEGGEPTQIFSGYILRAVVSNDGQALTFTRGEKGHDGNLYLLELPDK